MLTAAACWQGKQSGLVPQQLAGVPIREGAACTTGGIMQLARGGKRNQANSVWWTHKRHSLLHQRVAGVQEVEHGAARHVDVELLSGGLRPRTASAQQQRWAWANRNAWLAQTWRRAAAPAAAQPNQLLGCACLFRMPKPCACDGGQPLQCSLAPASRHRPGRAAEQV